MATSTTYDFKNLIDENGFKSEDDNFYANLRAFLEDTSKVPIDHTVGVLFKYILRPLILSLLNFNENKELIDLVYGFLNYHLEYHTGIDVEEFLLDLKRFVRIIRLTIVSLGVEGYVPKFISGIYSISSKEKRDKYLTEYLAEISSPTHSEAEHNVDFIRGLLTKTRVHSSLTKGDQSSSTLHLYSFKEFGKIFLKARIRPEVAQFIKTKKKPLVLTEIDRLVKHIAENDSYKIKNYIPALNRLKHEGKLSEAEHKKILEILGVPAPAQGGGAKKSKRKRRATSRRANKLTNKRKGRHNKKRTNKKN